MVQATSEWIIEGLRDVPSARALTPGQVLLAIIAALHGDAILHRANDGAEVAAHAVLLDDARDAVRGIAA
jgi:hypothetical protein